GFDLDEEWTNVDLELGLSIWDQLGLVFLIGYGSGESKVVSLAPMASTGPGALQVSERALRLGFEPRYRLLVSIFGPAYIDFVVGLQAMIRSYSANGPALYSTSESCRPDEQGCLLSVHTAPELDNDYAYGLSVGVDLRSGPILVGYRFIPEAVSDGMTDMHTISIGLSFF
ncbi:MAG: hypothetical protein RBU37_04885, partial [Myxococcota bacterium]|nr:hypothetical protein [Myxococcota bacterium]